MATWPASLPQAFRVDGFERTYPDNRLRTQTEQGPPKMRLRSTLNVSIMRGSMIFTKAQKTTFDTFFTSTTSGGVLQFDFPDLDGTVLQARFGENLPNVVLESPDIFRADIELEILP